MTDRQKRNYVYEFDQMVTNSASLVLASAFLLFSGFILVPMMIDLYVAYVPLPPPEMMDGKAMLEGLKIAGMAVGGAFGTFGFLVGSGWLVISLIFVVIDRIFGLSRRDVPIEGEEQ